MYALYKIPGFHGGSVLMWILFSVRWHRTDGGHIADLSDILYPCVGNITYIYMVSTPRNRAQIYAIGWFRNSHHIFARKNALTTTTNEYSLLKTWHFPSLVFCILNSYHLRRRKTTAHIPLRRTQ